MSTPTRPPRPPAFEDGPEAEYQDKLEGTADVLEQLQRRRDPNKHLTPVPSLKPAGGAGMGASTTTTENAGLSTARVEDSPKDFSSSGSPSSDSDEVRTRAEPVRRNTGRNSPGARQADSAGSTNGSVHRINDAPSRGVGAKPTGAHLKPPAPWVSFDVYSRLTEFSESEKRTKRSAARPFGVIVMDAIERHSDALASTWKQSGSETPPAGKLFVRAKNSRYRRHAMPPRSITLQGMSPDNAKLLKKLQKHWGAGSVSDLVEQALRLEFGMEPRSSEQAAEDGRS